MKVIQIIQPGEIKVVEIDKPVVGQGEVLVKIKYVGFCGSDLNTYSGKNPMVKLPVIPGHEIGAVIEAVGERVPSHLQVGMSCTINPYTACGSCPSCRNGRSNACQFNQTFGVQRNGAMCEYLVVHWGKVIADNEISQKDFALVEPMSVGFHAVARAEVTDLDKVMVIGCGMIGVGAIVRAGLRGAQVIAVDVDDKKLELAKKLGAKYTINFKQYYVHLLSKKMFAGYIVLILLTLPFRLFSSEWQWSTTVNSDISSETNANPRAFLWIPDNCEQVRSVVVGQHNMCEETIFRHPAFRQMMTELGFGIIWISPGFEQRWDIKNGCQTIFDNMMNRLAEVSGYSELTHVPIVPLGHSAMATYPWNFAAWNPARTLAIVSYHGDAPRTNLTGYGNDNLECGRTRNIDGIPGLLVIGEHEWWEARVNPALAFRMMYPESCISFLCDAGNGHFDVSDQTAAYIALFIKKAAQYRLPALQPLDQPAELQKVVVDKGWLAERWHSRQTERAKPAPFLEYQGDAHDAFWYFDEEMAALTENIYAKSRKKKEQYIDFVGNGKLVSQHKNLTNLKNLNLQSDGLTFTLSAMFTDSLREKLTTEHSHKGKIKIERICGPVEKVNDTTFTVRFYCMGLNNSRRTASIWLMAHHDGDDEYKNAAYQVNVNFPYPLTEGKEQQIRFDSIPNVAVGTKSISLKAKTDSKLPVYYYIKEGPAEIKNGKLIFAKIPPRSKYPVKVTVVAWQYGLTGERSVQTAEPVERSFYINK